jgi:flagellar protein FliO/FliZ
MRRRTVLVLVGFAFASMGLIWIPALAQTDVPVDEGSAAIDTSAPGDQPSSETIALPEDVPTRESFEGERLDEQRQLGPTATDYIKMLVALVVVIGVVWGLSLLLKRFVTVRGIAGASNSLKVLNTLSLSPTRTLYMVRLGDRILLIGAGEGGIRTLAEITDPAEVSDILKELEFKGNFDLNPFKDRLQSILGSSEPDLDIDGDLDKRQRALKGTLDRLREISRDRNEQ